MTKRAYLYIIINAQKTMTMYMTNQVSLDAKNEVARLERLCEKNDVELERHFNYDRFNELWFQADQKTREWFEIDAPIHLWEDGYAQGDASTEEEFDFEELDRFFVERYRELFTEEIQNTETAILNEIEL